MLKIALTGPESTGKTTLATQLAQHYCTIYVPEYARDYIANLTQPYGYQDILKIAKGQLALEKKQERFANKLLLCDTELLVAKIWCLHKYQQCHPWILEQLAKQTYDLYLLLQPDIPWAADPQREHPHLRRYLYDWYKRELTQMRVHFVEISGSYKNRLQEAIQAIDALKTTKN